MVACDSFVAFDPSAMGSVSLSPMSRLALDTSRGNPIESWVGMIRFFLPIALFIMPLPAWSQDVAESAQITASDGAIEDAFGTSLGISGDLMVVGASLDDDACPTNNSCFSGSAYVYRFDPVLETWVEQQKLTASDQAFRDQFGHASDVSGDFVVVSSRLDDDVGFSSGSVYVFRYDPGTDLWLEEQKLTASDGAAGDVFGNFGALKIQDDVIAAGAPFKSDSGMSSGAAYVFRYNPTTLTWEEEQKLTPSDPGEGKLFGATIELVGDTLVIGAPGEICPSNPSCYEGAVYLFRYDPVSGSWNEEFRLEASDGAVDDGFGSALSLNEDVLAIGANRDDDACPANSSCDSGSVYIFRFDSSAGIWQEEQKITAATTAEDDRFGYALSVSGDLILTSAIGANVTDTENGAAYLFEYNSNTQTWVEYERFVASDSSEYWRIGTSLAIADDTAFVGATQFSILSNSNDNGAIYLYPLGDCNGNGVPDSEDIATGTSPDCNNNGRPDVCDIAAGVSLDRNSSGIPDECEQSFIRADSNGDGLLNLSDPVASLRFLFLGGPSLCLDAEDTNDDGSLNLFDPTYTLTYMFVSGPAIPAPFPACGEDSTPDDVDCILFSLCP